MTRSIRQIIADAKAEHHFDGEKLIGQMAREISNLEWRLELVLQELWQIQRDREADSKLNIHR